MKVLLHQLIQVSNQRFPQHVALEYKDQQISYSELNNAVADLANQWITLNIRRYDRIAVYLPKTIETVVSFFSIAAAGAIFVPLNPLLKPAQVEYILDDCEVKILITSFNRLKHLLPELLPEQGRLKNLEKILIIDEIKSELLDKQSPLKLSPLKLNFQQPVSYPTIASIDSDSVAILYTSGSTGKPKGVVLSHRNMVSGAESVADYLNYSNKERILAVLPFSFDYGFSQLSSAFAVGARVVLMEYLLPRDVLRAVEKYQITGLAAVPPLWIQLAQLEWPTSAKQSLRYITNSGGVMPLNTLNVLRKELPETQIYLMYGLTEAFRSTYLDPQYLDSHPGSMGKAIPNAEILVLRPDGSECDIDEPGELIHRGALVAQGYWNKPEASAAVFKPLPDGIPTAHPSVFHTELAVFSGDQVYKDKDGFLYFINRQDEMIKTSGYRVSPNEIEEVCFAFPGINEAVAVGVPHPTLGQAIVIIACTEESYNEKDFLHYIKHELPNFMQPGKVIVKQTLPRNPNGKIDRKGLSQEFHEMFSSTSDQGLK